MAVKEALKTVNEAVRTVKNPIVVSSPAQSWLCSVSAPSPIHVPTQATDHDESLQYHVVLTSHGSRRSRQAPRTCTRAQPLTIIAGVQAFSHSCTSLPCTFSCSPKVCIFASQDPVPATAICDLPGGGSIVVVAQMPGADACIATTISCAIQRLQDTHKMVVHCCHSTASCCPIKHCSELSGHSMVSRHGVFKSWCCLQAVLSSNKSHI